MFLSYAHESPEHKADVLRLYDLLHVAGVDAILDQVQAQIVQADGGDPDTFDWVDWTRQQVDNVDFVLVIASPAYKRRSDAPADVPRNVGRGVWWEADYIKGILYDSKGAAYRRILPVVLPDGSAVFLPPGMFRPDHPTFQILELTIDGVAGLVNVLLGHVGLPPVGPTVRAGWAFAGPEGPEGVRSHIERRGRGQRSSARAGDLFRGRIKALKAVTDWLQHPEPLGRVLVVTGQPGAGKSAVVAKAALDLEPAAAGARLGLVFHARSATLLHLLHAVAVATGTDAAESTNGMIDNVRGATRPAGGWWRIVVDALDEAIDAERGRLTEALVELAALPHFRVVVATRALRPDTGSRFVPGALLPALGVRDENHGNLIDLDTDDYFEPAGLVSFVTALLRQEGAANPGPTGGAWQLYRSDPVLVTRLASMIAARANRNHLVAALTADPLSQQGSVIDPAVAGFDSKTLPSSVGEALAKYLDQQPEQKRARVRGLLTALAYARGTGVDDDLWLAFAGALNYPATGFDLDVLRGGAVSDYLLETSTVDGVRVTRLFHQALSDELLATRPAQADEARILTVLTPASSEGWLTASQYARTQAAGHAKVGGRLDELLDDPVYPTVAELTELLPVLPNDPRDRAAPVAAVLRMAATHARDLDTGPARASLLALTAAHLGLPALARRYHSRGQMMIDWAHARGARHQTLTGHRGGVEMVAIGRAGDRDIIVSGSLDKTVRVWDAITGAPIGQPITSHTDAVESVAIGRAGGRDIIVSGSNDKTVRVWDAITGAPIGQPITGHTDVVMAVAAGRAGDRDIIVSGSTDTTVRIWDAITGRPLGQMGGHTARVWAVALGRAGDRGIIVSGSGDKTARVWDATTGVPIGQPLTGHTHVVNAIDVGRAGDREIIVTGSWDMTVRIWDAVTLTPIGEPLAGHTGPVKAVAVGRVGERDIIVSASDDTTLRVWDAITGKPLGDPLIGHTTMAWAAAVGRAGDRDIIVSGGFDNTVRIWDATIGIPIGDPLTGHTETVFSLGVGRAGTRDIIASGSPGSVATVGDKVVRVWDATTGENLGRLIGHSKGVTAVAVGRAGDRDIIVSASQDATVRIWEATTGIPISQLTGYTSSASRLAIGRAGGRDIIVTTHGDKTIRVWDATSGKPLGQTLSGHNNSMRALALGRAGGRDIIVTGSDDTTVRVWDAATGIPIGQPIGAHTKAVSAVAVGRAGNRDIIVTASWDSTVKIWDATTLAPIGRPLTGHTGGVSAVAVGRVGIRDIIASGGDNTVRVWDAVMGTVIKVQPTLDHVRDVAIIGDRIVFAAGIAVCAAKHVEDLGAIGAARGGDRPLEKPCEGFGR